MDEFNAAATPKKSPREALLESIAHTRANLALADAAKKHDWAEAARLQSGGADVMHRDRAALKEMAASDDIAVADLMEKIESFRYPPLMGYTLVRAAESGNLATIAHIIAKQPPTEMLNQGLCSALMKKQEAAADLLLTALPEKKLRDNALFGFLVARPAEYERITAAREPGTTDYLMHFINACIIKDTAAIDTSLEKMLSSREDMRQRIAMADMGFMDMGGSLLHEITAHVFESGHIPAIDKFIDAFRNDMMPDFLLLHVALTVGGGQPEMFAHLAEKLQVRPENISAILMHGASPDRRAAAQFLMDKYPDQVKEDSYGVLRSFAGSDKPQDFFDALAKGIPLPKDEKETAQLLVAALEAKNDKVAAHVETAMGVPTPAMIDELQKSRSTEAMLKSALFSGDWHFRDDALFWRAASEGRRDILDIIPAEEKLTGAMAWLLRNALQSAATNGDQALIDDIIARTPWDDELRDKALETFMEAPQYLPLIDKIGCAPRALTDSDMHDIMHGKGAQTLGWLLEHGFTMDDKAAASALEIAVKQNESSAVEFLLGGHAEMTEAPRLKDMIDMYAEPATIDCVEKWLRREEVQPRGDIRARIDAIPATDLFSLGVEAAYADAFGGIMQKAAQENAAGFDPGFLSRTKDAWGNSLLDILGAHGKLDEILVPELWRDKDAVSFIRDNVPPCYQEQCDFNGLKAALDQLRLKDLSRRVRLGPKGP